MPVRLPYRVALLLVLAAPMVACGADDDDRADASADAASSTCTPGAQRACACGDAGVGQSICGNSGQFGVCYCPGAPLPGTDAGAAPDSPAVGSPDMTSPQPDSALVPDMAGGLDAGSLPGDTRDTGAGPADAPAPGVGDAIASDGAISGPLGGCAPPRMLASGSERLVDVFVTADGIIVIHTGAISLIGRDGVVKTTVTAPRPITTAAFDGTSLVTADAAMLSVYSPALQFQGMVLLTEACASSALMDAGIFVCGPANDWDRVFYTYDVRALSKVATASKKYTYNGIPMRRVPGTAYFVTVTTSSSPSDFHLYRVDPDGKDVVYVNESPYHGDFGVTEIYGFAGTPPTHLVNYDGLLLRLFGDGCDMMHNSFTSGCFVKDGNLGTLWTNQRFLALTNDADGALYGVVAKTGSFSSFDPACKDGCLAQKIDVAGRKVISSRDLDLKVKRVLFSRADGTCKMLVVASEALGSGGSSSFDWSGYRVDLVDYGMP
jgi:hypothetical protein